MLAKIMVQKKRELESLKKSLNPSEIAPRSQQFQLQEIFSSPRGQMAVIAEIKQASPSKGLLCADFNPQLLAESYVENGAAALSVITDREFFRGSPDFLSSLRPMVHLPMLRKDFIIDELQLYETVLLEADLVLLIAAMHEYPDLLALSEKSQALGLEPLVEVHNQEELKKALDLPVRMMGINNRNLKDFSVDLRTSLQLAERIPESFIKVSESGIKTPADMKLLVSHGFQAALIGETLVSAADPGAKLKELVHYEQS